MAGNPQGGAAPQQNMGQMGNQMQGMRQGMAGMPSQVPGANLAAPGGMQVNQAGQMPPPQMPQGGQTTPAPAPQSITIPMYDNRVNAQAPAPQLPPQYSGSTNPTQLDPSMLIARYQPAMAHAPQLPPQYSGSTNPTQLDPSMLIAQYQQASGQQGPQAPISVGAYSPQAPQRPMPMMNDARFQQNPGMTPRPMPRPMPQGRPQIQGNPNAMPVMRNMRGRT